MKGFVIGALLVALIAVGYMYYVDENTISIGTAGSPDVELSTN